MRRLGLLIVALKAGIVNGQLFGTCIVSDHLLLAGPPRRLKRRVNHLLQQSAAKDEHIRALAAAAGLAGLAQPPTQAACPSRPQAPSLAAPSALAGPSAPRPSAQASGLVLSPSRAPQRKIAAANEAAAALLAAVLGDSGSAGPAPAGGKPQSSSAFDVPQEALYPPHLSASRMAAAGGSGQAAGGQAPPLPPSGDGAGAAAAAAASANADQERAAVVSPARAPPASAGARPASPPPAATPGGLVCPCCDLSFSNLDSLALHEALPGHLSALERCFAAGMDLGWLGEPVRAGQEPPPLPRPLRPAQAGGSGQKRCLLCNVAVSLGRHVPLPPANASLALFSMLASCPMLTALFNPC